MTIRYSHTSPATAATLADAIRAARNEAIRIRCTSDADIVVVGCADGHYCYLSQADADADDTGANAFAVITTGTPNEEN